MLAETPKKKKLFENVYVTRDGFLSFRFCEEANFVGIRSVRHIETFIGSVPNKIQLGGVEHVFTPSVVDVNFQGLNPYCTDSKVIVVTISIWREGIRHVIDQHIVHREYISGGVRAAIVHGD